MEDLRDRPHFFFGDMHSLELDVVAERGRVKRQALLRVK